MKASIFLAGIIPVALIAGCASTATVRLTVDNAMKVAEAGAIGINQGAIAAAQGGLHGQGAATLKGVVDTANQSVSAAHAVYRGAPSPAAATAATNALNAIAAAQRTVAP